ncbi:hypothetical protein DFP74_0048 [Nocardiopsis sp. Huas11]|uniref:hypothetical protein n=1 Tax=Nocardiopsis sp. Huas11 TaxID=2183912 RepID=UPI000EAEA36D|nr:hypothetical protein [Nocardiopsis sp. Huas11]RKS04490.1 hypothetical protein DFP74_0048 [Nocardiopsis sp. Huas11]
MGYGTPDQVLPPPPPPPLGPGVLPGSAAAVRVLMTIGGILGLLCGAAVGAVAAIGSGTGAMAEAVGEGSGNPEAVAELSPVLWFAALVPLAYGVVSCVLAMSMRRRRPFLYWSVITFQSVAALILLLAIFAGDTAVHIPLVFAVLMIGLMLPGRVRAYYGA